MFFFVNLATLLRPLGRFLFGIRASELKVGDVFTTRRSLYLDHHDAYQVNEKLLDEIVLAWRKTSFHNESDEIVTINYKDVVWPVSRHKYERMVSTSIIRNDPVNLAFRGCFSVLIGLGFMIALLMFGVAGLAASIVGVFVPNLVQIVPYSAAVSVLLILIPVIWWLRLTRKGHNLSTKP